MHRFKLTYLGVNLPPDFSELKSRNSGPLIIVVSLLNLSNKAEKAPPKHLKLYIALENLKASSEAHINEKKRLQGGYRFRFEFEPIVITSSRNVSKLFRTGRS